VDPGRITGGRILFEDVDLTGLSEKAAASLSRGRVGMIFQEPAAALNPVLRIGTQVSEALRIHKDSRASSRGRNPCACWRQSRCPTRSARRAPIRMSCRAG
jgi:ABC-type dipeptide/oligopeptide/nickel transport system ATPase component